TDAETNSSSSGATVSRTGGLVSGTYSLHQTGSSTSTVSDTSADDTHATGTAGSTDNDDSGGSSRRVQTQSSTLDRTGNALSGSYSLHQTATSGLSDTDSDADTVAAAPGDGETDHEVQSGGSTGTVTGTSTLDRTGNEVSGTYSLHEVSG